MNKVIIMGRLTKDPDLRYTAANNTAVCSFIKLNLIEVCFKV